MNHNKHRYLAILLLWAAPAFAADYHVMRDSDGDGKANACPNPSHQAHYSADSVTCGTTFDIDNDGTAETVFCNLQNALNAAVNPRDTVDIHQGTWSENDSTVMDAWNLCVKDAAGQSMATVRGCSSCNDESDRRIIRASTMLGTSYDNVSFDYAATSIEAPLTLGYAPNADASAENVRYLTIEGIRFNEVKWNSCDNSYLGFISLAGAASHLRVVNNEFFAARYDNDAKCVAEIGATSEAGVTAVHPIGFTSSRDDTDIEIVGNTMKTCTGFTFKGAGASDGSGGSPYFQRIWFHGNDVTQLMQGRSGSGATSISANLGELKGIEDLIISDNIFRGDGASIGYTGKLRYDRGGLYIFNNYFENVTNVFFDQGCNWSDGVYIFNNTVHQTRSVSTNRWYQTSANSGYPYRFRNNSFTNFSSGYAWEQAGSGGNTVNVSHDHFDQSNRYSEWTPNQDSGAHVCNDSQACGANSSFGECSGSGGCNASGVTASRTGSAPWNLSDANGSAVLIDAGSNNPLGGNGTHHSGGPGICVINLGGWSIDCSLDYDGEDRDTAGISWDIGADEFSAGLPACEDGIDNDGDGATDFPADDGCTSSGDSDERRCGDDFLDTNEQCEGGDLGGSSCQSLGFDGGSLSCSSSCTYDTSTCTSDAAPPDYEGFGAVTSGGAGGEVYHVTSLADSGPGTLRDAVLNRDHAVDGPRTVVFDVGGEITLQSDIRLGAPHSQLTIDGSTAPAPGITIRKVSVGDGEFLLVGTSDVIIRHLRFQGHWQAGNTTENNAATISLDGDNDNVVLDHLTIRNGTDGSPDIYGTESDITMQWCFIFNNWHPTTVSSGSDDRTRQRISLHHNVYASNGERSPQLYRDVRELEFVNNIVYDWGHFSGGSYGMRIKNNPNGAKVAANIVNNQFVGTSRLNSALVYGSAAGADVDDCGPAQPAGQGSVVTSSCMGQLWVSGNVLPSENLDNYSTIGAPLTIPSAASITTHSADELGTRVLPDVGMMYRTSEEQQLLDELLTAMGTSGGGTGSPPVAPQNLERGDVKP